MHKDEPLGSSVQTLVKWFSRAGNAKKEKERAIATWQMVKQSHTLPSKPIKAACIQPAHSPYQFVFSFCNVHESRSSEASRWVHMYIMGYIDVYSGFWLWPQIIGAITDMYIADYPKPTIGDTQILVKVNNVSDLIFFICCLYKRDCYVKLTNRGFYWLGESVRAQPNGYHPTERHVSPSPWS
jgi:hypothetical protein